MSSHDKKSEEGKGGGAKILCKDQSGKDPRVTGASILGVADPSF
jgi:hypothetical protein